jgi:hypothetical protein
LKRILLALVAVGTLAPLTALASTTTLTASPASSVVGQKVTFTGKFTPTCAGVVKTSYFTIDGKQYPGSYSQVGQNSTGTYSTSALKAGKHTVKYQWSISASCNGSASLSYTVAPKPSPVPSASPAPSPSPTPLPSAAPSPTPVALVSDRVDDSPAAYIGVALIVVSILAGAGLVIYGRR